MTAESEAIARLAALMQASFTNGLHRDNEPQAFRDVATVANYVALLAGGAEESAETAQLAADAAAVGSIVRATKAELDAVTTLPGSGAPLPDQTRGEVMTGAEVGLYLWDAGEAEWMLQVGDTTGTLSAKMVTADARLNDLETTAIPGLDARTTALAAIISIVSSPDSQNLFQHLTSEGSSVVEWGPKRFFAAGLWFELQPDGSYTISTPTGVAFTITAAGAVTANGIVSSIVNDGDQITASSIINVAGKDNAGFDIAVHTANGLLYIAGMEPASPAASVEDTASFGSALLGVFGKDGAGVEFTIDENGRVCVLGADPLNVDLKPTDIRYYGLEDDPAGVMDQTSALKAAHDAAAAAGIRFLDFGTYTINAPSLSRVDNVFFIGARGRGQLIGTASADAYRKQVLPYGIEPRIPKSTINPRQHLAKFAAASSPVVVITGDSTVLTNAGLLGQRCYDLLVNAVRLENPGKDIAFYQRSIGGQTFATHNMVASANWPTWYTNHSAPWIEDYIKPLAPDWVHLQFGENDQDFLTFETIDAVVAQYLAFAKIPDLTFATCLFPSGMNTSQTVYTKANQEKRAYAAGMVRTYANRMKFGLIDFNQREVIIHDGIDVVDQAHKMLVQNGTGTLPVTLPECTDYSLSMHNGGTGFAPVFSGGGQLEFPLSGVAGNSLLLRVSGGVVQYRVQTSDTRAVIDWTNAVGNPTGVLNVQFSIHSSGACVLSLDNVEQPIGFVDRFGGLFVPVIGKRGGGSALPIDTIYIGIGEPRLCLPALTDIEMWGPNINHMWEGGRRIVYGGAIEATNWGT